MGTIVRSWPLLAACLVAGQAEPSSADQGGKPEGAFDKIVLTSSGGFSGRGSGKAFTVDGQGKFTVGSRNQGGTGALKPEELRTLRQRVAAVDWKKVEPSYQGVGSDFFQDDLSVTVGGKTHMTQVSEEVDRGKLPAGLRELLAYLDGLYGRYKSTPSKE